MKTTLKIIVLFISILLTSCNANLNIGDGIEGSGNVITEKRKITDSFTKIKASTGVEVILEQGNTTEIEVEIDDNLIEYVNKAVAELPEKQRSALTLRDFEGHDYRTIGEITGMNESQVKVNIFRARKYIKEYIQKLEVMTL